MCHGCLDNVSWFFVIQFQDFMLVFPKFPVNSKIQATHSYLTFSSENWLQPKQLLLFFQRKFGENCNTLEEAKVYYYLPDMMLQVEVWEKWTHVLATADDISTMTSRLFCDLKNKPLKQNRNVASSTFGSHGFYSKMVFLPKYLNSNKSLLIYKKTIRELFKVRNISERSELLFLLLTLILSRF